MLKDDEYVYTIAVNYDYDKREFYLGMFKHLPDDEEMECVEMSVLTDERFKDLSLSEFLLEFERFKSQSMTTH